jgi:hypothetical protein
MKLIPKLGLALIAAIILGAGSAYAVFINTAQNMSAVNGQWTYTLSAGNENADMYTRAAIAKVGLLALNRSETIYYMAGVDAKGDTFSENCRYRLTGPEPDARWWSLTLYGEDHFLIPNDEDRYAYSQTEHNANGQPSINIALSPVAVPGVWLPTKGGGNVNLILRLYNPGANVQENPGSVVLPTITKEACS